MNGVLYEPTFPPATFPQSETEDLLGGSVHEFLTLVYDAAQQSDWSCALPKARPAFSLCTTLLTYCYGRGIYSAQEIETLARTDAGIRYICVGKPPSAEMLRRFRRSHRHVLERTLTALIHRISPALVSLGAARREAGRRILRAIRRDSSDLDF